MQDINQKNARIWSRLGQRGTFFGLALPEIAEQQQNVYVLTADLGLLSGLDRFKTKFPERYLNVGIAEQNMVGIAAGLAKEGNCAFVTTYATFASMRCFEQIRHNLGYQKQNVKIVGSSSGLAMGMSGNTHYAFEDIAIMRAIPNLVVLSPADAVEAYCMAYAAAKTDAPMYIRLTGGLNNAIVHTKPFTFEVGKALNILEGSDVAILATGSMVAESLSCATQLAQQGTSVAVFDYHTIKPLDTKTLDSIAKQYPLIVTVEEHSVIGGLGGAVAEYLSDKPNRPQHIKIGIEDHFFHPAQYDYLLDECGLRAANITQRILDALKNSLN